MQFAILAMHVIASSSFILFLRHSSKQQPINPYVMAFMSTIPFQLTILLLVIVGVLNPNISEIETNDIITMAIGCVFLVGYFLLSVNTLNYLESSRYSIIFTLRLALITIFAFVFLSETPTLLQALGGLTILTALLILNFKRGSITFGKGERFALLTVLVFSAHAITEKYNIDNVSSTEETLPSTYIVVFSSMIFIAQGTLLVIKRVPISQIRGTMNGWLWAAAMARNLSGWGWLWALTLLPVAIVNYVSGLSLLVVVLFGTIVLKERSDLKKISIATALSVTGLTLIFLTNS